MLEISAVSVLDNVKPKLTPYQLIFHYKWLQNFLHNNDNPISSEIGSDKKVALGKDHLFITITFIGLYKHLTLIIDKWNAELNSVFFLDSYTEAQSLLKKEEFTIHYYS